VKDDRLYLIHISECIDRVERYTESGKTAFLSDTKTQDAVLRNLQTLGESARRISASLRTKYPEVEWRSILGFRNVLVHGYLAVDLQRVWEIVDHDLPILKRTVQRMLGDRQERDGRIERYIREHRKKHQSKIKTPQTAGSCLRSLSFILSPLSFLRVRCSPV
jgi:uncharacterized protein with HEPN domain